MPTVDTGKSARWPTPVRELAMVIHLPGFRQDWVQVPLASGRVVSLNVV